MLENPIRQLIVILLVIATSIGLAVAIDTNLGPDLKGGVQLTYEIPEDRIQEQLANNEGLDRQTLIRNTLIVIRERIDPNGALGAQVNPQGSNGFLIELPAMTDANLRVVENNIETLGQLEFRMLAYNGEWQPPESADDPEPIDFDLDAEKTRLENWLQQDSRMIRAQSNPVAVIGQYNVLPTQRGGPLNEHLRWYPHEIAADANTEGQTWSYSFSQGDKHPSVPAFEEATFTAGPQAEGAPELLYEYVPINMKEQHFMGSDLDGAGTRPDIDPNDGKPVVAYQLDADNTDRYAAFSEFNIGRASAIILNGIIKSAPEFQDRIPGRGIIRGNFTQEEVENLVKVLRTGSLQVEPIRQSKISVGATLGQDSIDRGILSILVGGISVLLFILWYYRMAGVVACVGIVLNLIAIWGALHFVGATLTLPGIAGIVLTIGMAVDANILIYERIREELRRGKDMLQACRTGFEKAIITILDANITTFIAGVVLFNVGVGPIRGFAVTLMAGILTSLFTALVVTRLIIDYLVRKRGATVAFG